MEDTNKEIIDSTNDAEGTVKAEEGVAADATTDETEGKPEFTEAERKAYARMKKAEAEAKEAKARLAQLTQERTSSNNVANVPDVEKLINETLEKRELESLDLSDEIKKEIYAYAKMNNIGVKKALNSNYITFLKGKEEQKNKVENASIGSNRKASTSKKDYSQMSPKDFDLRTPEGKADWASYNEWLRKQ